MPIEIFGGPDHIRWAGSDLKGFFKAKCMYLKNPQYVHNSYFLRQACIGVSYAQAKYHVTRREKVNYDRLANDLKYARWGRVGTSRQVQQGILQQTGDNLVHHRSRRLCSTYGYRDFSRVNFKGTTRTADKCNRRCRCRHVVDIDSQRCLRVV